MSVQIAAHTGTGMRMGSPNSPQNWSLDLKPSRVRRWTCLGLRSILTMGWPSAQSATLLLPQTHVQLFNHITNRGDPKPGLFLPQILHQACQLPEFSFP